MNNTSQATGLKKYLDSIQTGFVLGLVLPMLMFYIYYLAKYSMMPWEEYVSEARDLAVLPSFIKVSVFINLPVFFLFNLLSKFNTCKGIFYASLLYIIAMLVIKFIL